MTEAIRKDCKFNSAQPGFQKRTGSETVIHRHMNNAPKLAYTAILDLNMAYTLAPREKVGDGLAKKLNRNTVDMVMKMLQEMKIRTSGKKSKTKGRTEKGVYQVSLLNPTLFNVCMDTYTDMGEEKIAEPELQERPPSR